MRFRVLFISLVLAAGTATESVRAATTIRVLNIYDPLAVAAFFGNNLSNLQFAINTETFKLNQAMAASQLSVVAQNVGVVQAPDCAIDSTATRDVAKNICKCAF